MAQFHSYGGLAAGQGLLAHVHEAEREVSPERDDINLNSSANHLHNAGTGKRDARYPPDPLVCFVVSCRYAHSPAAPRYLVEKLAVLGELSGHSRISHRCPRKKTYANPRTVAEAFTVLSRVPFFQACTVAGEAYTKAQNHLNIG